MPVGDPDLFPGRFLRILLHQDFGTSLQKKSLNSGYNVLNRFVRDFLRKQDEA
jgi:hypothetical protein